MSSRFERTFRRLGLVKGVIVGDRGQVIAVDGEVSYTEPTTAVEAAVVNIKSSDLQNDTTGLLTFDSMKFYFFVPQGLKNKDSIQVVGGSTYTIIMDQPRDEGGFEMYYANLVKKNG